MINLIPGVQSSTAALQAERLRLDVISQNIANAYTTRAANGLPYQRQQVVFEAALARSIENSTALSVEPRVARIEKDSRPPMMIHNPTHPDAGPDGMVAMPDINIHEEMADMVIASRAYEANLAVIKNARSMAMAALAIGKR